MSIPQFLEESRTPSRLDKIGTAMIEDPESVSGVEALELLSDLLGVEEVDILHQMAGQKFVPVPKKEFA